MARLISKKSTKMTLHMTQIHGVLYCTATDRRGVFQWNPTYKEWQQRVPKCGTPRFKTMKGFDLWVQIWLRDPESERLDEPGF